jgi:hypothetical protein
MTRAAQSAGRRLPTADQARRVAQRAEEILGEWQARGLPTLAAIEVGPVRLEFVATQGDAAPKAGTAEGQAWQGRPFG